MLTIGVLASGSGTNLQAILDETKRGLPAKVGVVISDVPGARALERARDAGVPAFAVPSPRRRTVLEPDVEERYAAILRDAGVRLVCLAGFMRVVKRPLLSAFPGAIVNIHPSLLPAFPGLEAWKQALAYGVRFSGCTVHYVNGGVDTGPIILQAAVPVLQDDTPETLHRRIHEKEYALYPLAVRLIAEGRVSIEGRKAVIS